LALTYSVFRRRQLETFTADQGSAAKQRHWRELGAKLHEQMDAAIAEASLSVPEHPDDDGSRAWGR